MKKLLSTLLLIWGTHSIAAENQFTIKSTIWQSGEVVGKPVIRVVENETASLSIEDTFTYEVKTNSLNDEQVVVSSILSIKGQQIFPKLTVELGKEASIQIGETMLTILVSKVKS